MSLMIATSTPHGRNMFVWNSSFRAPCWDRMYEWVQTGSTDRWINRLMGVVPAKYSVKILSIHQVDVWGR
jgi:hypothetical protein